MSDDAYWEELWNARLAALEGVFGAADESVLHSAVPFFMGHEMGGNPDVVSFSGFTDGKLYVTAELIGADHPPNGAGSYELAIAHPGAEDWGIFIICQLAHYSAEHVIEHGHSMDITSQTPDGSTIEALLFRRIAQFEVQGIESNVLCCIGITGAELAYKQAHGADALIDQLGQAFFLTDLFRPSRL